MRILYTFKPMPMELEKKWLLRAYKWKMKDREISEQSAENKRREREQEIFNAIE